MLLSQFLSSSNSGLDMIDKCDYAFNCVASDDGLDNNCQVCDDLSQTCTFPNAITCSIG